MNLPTSLFPILEIPIHKAIFNKISKYIVLTSKKAKPLLNYEI